MNTPIQKVPAPGPFNLARNPHGTNQVGLSVTNSSSEQPDAGYVVSRPPANPHGGDRKSDQVCVTNLISEQTDAGYVVSRPPANPNGTNRFSDTKATNAQPDAGYVVSRLKHSSLTGGSLIPIAQASIPQFLLVKKSPRNLEGSTHVVTVCPVSIGDCFRRRLVMSACLGVTCDC